MRTETRCEMIIVHHPDCTCEWCARQLDERCAAAVVATVCDQNKLRVCEECAIVMAREDWPVSYLDGRTAPLS